MVIRNPATFIFISVHLKKSVPITYAPEVIRESANRHGYLTSTSVGGAVTLCSNANSVAPNATSLVKIFDIGAKEFELFRDLVARSLLNIAEVKVHPFAEIR